MKAIVYTRNGPAAVLWLTEVPRPEPRQDQVLVKVHAASANALDSRRFEGVSLETDPGSTARRSGYKVLGADIAGRVETVGAAVTQFRPGDEVFGVAAGSAGGFAEYACAPEGRLAPKPANLSFEAAAAIPIASMTALQGLRDKGKIRSGQKVLINGASGGVGTFAVQIAKSYGAEVTAVCSTRNLDTARSIGADHVIDYRREDFTRNGKRYDLILGVNGYHPILDYRRALSPGGRYVAIGGSMPQILQGILMGPVLSLVGSKKMGFMGIARTNQKDLIFVRDLVEAGNVAPVIDRIYPLREAAAAFRYLTGEHAAGKVVFAVDQELVADSSHFRRPS
jgi:NADPH:quinone reductase-like Zn-dependent oxidoreductase